MVIPLTLEEINRLKIETDKLEQKQNRLSVSEDAYKSLSLEMIKEFQRSVKKAKQQSTQLNDKKMLIKKVVEKITISNENITLYINLKSISNELKDHPIPLISINRKRLLSKKKPLS